MISSNFGDVLVVVVVVVDDVYNDFVGFGVCGLSSSESKLPSSESELSTPVSVPSEELSASVESAEFLSVV
eukprot:CAMPEP_0114671492 /NCGR_PEP_ID=MMETSP0191-20121206/41249_1 /TAXON_ID=126664 /ORGANISM="Sorites sp." /LENGTH=70 /DNA_ID=CAMNT_0001931463 /DNA_START=78 /DNA_END=287 /DNA_ORIENTATION=-